MSFATSLIDQPIVNAPTMSRRTSTTSPTPNRCDPAQSVSVPARIARLVGESSESIAWPTSGPKFFFERVSTSFKRSVSGIVRTFSAMVIFSYAVSCSLNETSHGIEQPGADDAEDCGDQQPGLALRMRAAAITY